MFSCSILINNPSLLINIVMVQAVDATIRKSDDFSRKLKSSSFETVSIFEKSITSCSENQYLAQYLQRERERERERERLHLASRAGFKNNFPKFHHSCCIDFIILCRCFFVIIDFCRCCDSCTLATPRSLFREHTGLENLIRNHKYKHNEKSHLFPFFSFSSEPVFTGTGEECTEH